MTGLAVCNACQQAVVQAVLPAWEVAEPRAMPGALFRTAASVIGSPTAFFQRVEPSQLWLRPAAFAVLCITIGTLARAGWEYAFVGEFPQLAQFAEEAQISKEAALPVFLVMLPFAVPVLFFVHATLLHASLRLAGADTSWGFSTRIAGYASSAYLFQLLPPIAGLAIGQFLAIVWLFRAEITAVAHYFEMGVWRAFAVVMVPFLTILALG
jgi:hypothetical protein